MLSDNQPSAPDPGSLQNLHDLVVPDPVPWWPPAPGWFLLGAIVLIGAVAVLIRAIHRYRVNRYRREGQRELAELRRLSHDPARRRAAIARTGRLLKRVALAGWPREQVAGLSGHRWLAFLNETGGDTLVSDQQVRTLEDLSYCQQIGDELSEADVDALFEMADRWIRHHHCYRAVTAGQEDAGC